jgi:hypothetical protein
MHRLLSTMGGSQGVVVAGDEYKAHAAECLRLAEQVKDQAGKSQLVSMAAAWLRLAELAEKNSQTVLVYEPPYVTDRAK